MSYEIVRDADGTPLEVRVTLPDGRIAITGFTGTALNPCQDIPSDVAAAITAEVQSGG